MTPRKHPNLLRILVAHSRPLTRKGIEAVLSTEADFVVVCAVGDGNRTVREIRHHHPDISIVEFELPPVGGLQIVATVTRDGLATKVLLLAEPGVGSDVYRAMTAGAFGYLTTNESIESILQAIRRAAAGQRTFSATALAALQEYLKQQALAGAANVKTVAGRGLLTDRETQVLTCMADGISISETGRRLHASQSTIKNHRHAIFAKLGVSNAPAAVSAAMRCGLLPGNPMMKVS